MIFTSNESAITNFKSSKLKEILMTDIEELSYFLGIMRYVKGMLNWGVLFPNHKDDKNVRIKGYSDAN